MSDKMKSWSADAPPPKRIPTPIPPDDPPGWISEIDDARVIDYGYKFSWLHYGYFWIAIGVIMLSAMLYSAMTSR